MIPIFWSFLLFFVPLVGGIILNYFKKSKEIGMITIMGFLLGLIMLLTGMDTFQLLQEHFWLFG